MNCCTSNRKNERLSNLSSTTALFEYMNSRTSATKLLSQSSDSAITSDTPTERPSDHWQSVMKQRRCLVANQKILWLLIVGVHSRTEVWKWITDMQHQYVDRHVPDLFEKLVALPSSSDDQIQKDVVRTTKEKEHQEGLFRVLRAYANYDPELGYTQGMNYIAGGLYEHLREEQGGELLTFWMLVYVLIEKSYRQVYRSGMIGAFELMQQIEAKLAQKVPAVSALMAEFEVSTQMGFDYMIFSMMLQHCPMEFGLRVIDLFILMGSEILVKIIVRMVKLMEQEILAQPSADHLIVYLRRSLVENAVAKLTAMKGDCMHSLFLQ